MSLILIGLGKKTFKDLGETGQKNQCVWCSALVFYHLILVRTWFTYFFIRIFSYRSEYRIECPVCACGIEIQGEEVKAAKRGELRLSISTTTSDGEQPSAAAAGNGQSRG